MLLTALLNKDGEGRSDADKSGIGLDPTFLFGPHHESDRRRLGIYGKVLPAHTLSKL